MHYFLGNINNSARMCVWLAFREHLCIVVQLAPELCLLRTTFPEVLISRTEDPELAPGTLILYVFPVLRISARHNWLRSDSRYDRTGTASIRRGGMDSKIALFPYFHYLQGLT